MWLGRYLTGVTAAVILVSHEHEFIEKACNHIAEVLLLSKNSVGAKLKIFNDSFCMEESACVKYLGMCRYTDANFNTTLETTPAFCEHVLLDSFKLLKPTKQSKQRLSGCRFLLIALVLKPQRHQLQIQGRK